MTTTAEHDLAFAGPGALADMVRRRELTPRELVELFLRRIEAIDRKLNAFRVTMAEEALAAAETMSSPDGPLAGVPVAIKDEMSVVGQSVTRGSRSFAPPEAADLARTLCELLDARENLQAENARDVVNGNIALLVGFLILAGVPAPRE